VRAKYTMEQQNDSKILTRISGRHEKHIRLQFFTWSGIFSWASKKQATVAQSSAEAEYIAAAATSNQAIWLRRILEDIGEKQEEPTTIYCDNKSAIAITKNPVQHSRTKHIDIKYHSLREATTRGEIELKYYSTEEQLADIFTKALPRNKFEELRMKIGPTTLILALFSKPQTNIPSTILPFVQTISGFFPNMSRLNGTLTQSIGRLSQLLELDFSINEFLEVQFSHRWAPDFLLEYLDLRVCKLGSNFPTWLKTQTELQYIDISGTGISDTIPGELPTSMSNCTSLEMIDVGDNRLTGKIPDWIGNSFSEVRILILSSNAFRSSIPLSLCRLANLQILDISSNKISGAIPECLQDFIAMTEKKILTCSGALRVISIYETVRKCIFDVERKGGDKPSLGSIPNSLCDLSHLGVLDLSYNNLSGRIPLNNQGLTFKESAFEGNVGLGGLPLNKSCPGDKSHQGPNSRVGRTKVGEEFEDDRFITDGFYISMGLGFIVGFWGIFGTILLNKTFRYAFFGRRDTIYDLVLVRIELSKARLWSCFENR
ncbi:Retrovirus-related Pol polyprotein from transposon TNT 1-94, partial [Sesamum angolense]